MKKLNFIIVSALIVSITGIFITISYSEIHIGILGAVKNKAKKLYDKVQETIIYPETDQSPELTIKWWTGATVPKEDVLSISSFGNRKLNMPGYGGQFTMFVASSAFKPIYALCDGVVVSLERGYDKDHQVIRYGKNYAIEYCHVVNLNPDLYIGKIVKKGDKIGEIWPVNTQGTQYPEGTGYYELRFLKQKEPGKWICANLYHYLDTASKQNIKEIWLEKAFNDLSTAGMTRADGYMYDIYGNRITTSTISGTLEEIDFPGSNYKDRILYDYWK